MDEAIFYIKHGNDQKPIDTEIKTDKTEIVNAKPEKEITNQQSNSVANDSSSSESQKDSEKNIETSTEDTKQVESSDSTAQEQQESEIDLFENQDASIVSQNSPSEPTAQHSSAKTPVKTTNPKAETPSIFNVPDELPLPSTELLDSDPLLPN